MRLIKMLGLAVLAAAAAMAFVGAGSASAKEDTLLCTVQHTEGLKCADGKAATTVHLADTTAGGGLLLSSLLNLLCLHFLGVVEALGLGTAPKAQELHTLSILAANCGSNAAHSNCTVTVNEVPLFLLLKTALNLGSLLGHGGLFRVQCTIGGIFKIDCEYTLELEFQVAAEGALHTEKAGHGMVTLNQAPALKVAGGGLCPEESTVDSLLEPLSHIWIADGKGPPPSGTALCKSHTSTCSEKDLVTSTHLVATEPVVLLNSVANVECDGALVTASVLGLATESTQKAHASEWLWSDCHTQGATGNCEVSTEVLPLVDFLKTSLNVGTATVLGIEVAVNCNVLGLHEMECNFAGTAVLQAEGALESEDSGHGTLTAAEDVLEEVSAGKYCPEGALWSGSFEALEHFFFVD